MRTEISTTVIFHRHCRDHLILIVASSGRRGIWPSPPSSHGWRSSPRDLTCSHGTDQEQPATLKCCLRPVRPLRHVADQREPSAARPAMSPKSRNHRNSTRRAQVEGGFEHNCGPVKSQWTKGATHRRRTAGRKPAISRHARSDMHAPLSSAPQSILTRLTEAAMPPARRDRTWHRGGVQTAIDAALSVRATAHFSGSAMGAGCGVAKNVRSC